MPETKKNNTVSIPKLERHKRLELFVGEEKLLPLILNFEEYNFYKGLLLGVLGNYVPLEGEESIIFLKLNPEYKKLYEGLVKRENYDSVLKVDRGLVQFYVENYNRIINDYATENYRIILDRNFNGRKMFESTAAFLGLSGLKSSVDEVTLRLGLLETIILSDNSKSPFDKRQLHEGFKELALKLYGVYKR